MKPEDLLDKVVDRDTFITFVNALAAEREQAQQMEQDDQRYQMGGAQNWQNGDIVSFTYAALEYFEPMPYHQPEETPSWRMLAEFLYIGKIYE